MSLFTVRHQHAGRTQPERAEWNRLGYGNNAIQEVSVEVSANV